jgi:hypothetical protein
VIVPEPAAEGAVPARTAQRAEAAAVTADRAASTPVDEMVADEGAGAYAVRLPHEGEDCGETTSRMGTSDLHDVSLATHLLSR